MEPRTIAEGLRFPEGPIAMPDGSVVLGRFDTNVPYENGLLLREALGEPEAYLLPWGHYSSVLAAPWAATTAIRWLARRLRAPGEPASEANPRVSSPDA